MVYTVISLALSNGSSLTSTMGKMLGFLTGMVSEVRIVNSITPCGPNRGCSYAFKISFTILKTALHAIFDGNSSNLVINNTTLSNSKNRRRARFLLDFLNNGISSGTFNMFQLVGLSGFISFQCALNLQC